MSVVKIKRRPEYDITLLPDTMSALMRKIYIARGVTSSAQLDRSLQGLLTYKQMGGVDEAVKLLQDAIDKNQRIIVVGDFDADGATSCAVSVLALRMLGSSNVDYLVPNRFEDGYGLSPEVVDQAINMGAEFIMTVDNGVSSISGVAHAKEKGLTVVVTDHHLPGDVLPIADAMVNPNLESCQFPSKALAGVGVAFYLMSALRAKMRSDGYFTNSPTPKPDAKPMPNLGELLDLVALGTVADVVPLDENNRRLVQTGLSRIRQGKGRPGIKALIEVAKRNEYRLVASDFGFALGPRLNAAGRLDDMSFGVELLICQDIHAARRMASELDSLNLSRREIEADMKREAMAFCERLQLSASSELPFGICLHQADWHQGVIGILASRIKDEFHRPVIAFADDATAGIIKGSARSIKGFHMRDALDRIDTQNPGLILKFGGHAMAAGLSIEASRFKEFCQKFDALVRSQLTESELEGEILSDGVLTSHDFNLETAQMIRDGGPWGQAFPEPIFDGEFIIKDQRLVGEKHLKLMLEVMHNGHGTGTLVDAIAFNVDLRRWPDAAAKTVHLAYRLDINEFRGNQSLQLMVESMDAKLVEA